MTLTEKYRPTTFEAVVGQAEAVEWCRGQIGKPRAGSAVFHGPTGTGKTTIAYLYAAALLCENRQASGSACRQCGCCRAFAAGNALNCFIEDCTKLDLPAVAHLVEISRANPLAADYRVFVFDEAQRLSPKGFDSLLTVLERPRRNVFIFMTTDSTKIPETIRHRCADRELALLDTATSVQHLAKVCAAEKIEAEPDALDLLAELAGGHARALLRNLEATIENNTVTASAVRHRFKLDFCDRLTAFLRASLNNDPAKAIAILEAWQDHPARKREFIHAAIVDLYRRDILRLR